MIESRINLTRYRRASANNAAILPYYFTNQNIEATDASIAGEYLEYPNLGKDPSIRERFNT